MSGRTASTSDDLVERAGKWVFAKVWLGCLLSGMYAFTRHFGWPEALVTAMAALGAVSLAVGAYWLPYWTHDVSTGILVIDVGARVMVWVGLVAAVVCLLIGNPAVGSVAGALLLTTAWRTFGRPPPELRPDSGPRLPS